MEPLYKEESYAIMGAAFEVYKELGSGFLEAVYQEALEREFALRGIPFQAKERIQITYKGAPLSKYYEADFLCFGTVILEIKALKTYDETHKAQLHNYLKATGLQLGILLNFGHHPQIQSKRIARSKT